MQINRVVVQPGSVRQGLVAYGEPWLLYPSQQLLGVGAILAGRPAGQDPARRLGGTGAVRPGRQTGAGSLLGEADRGALVGRKARIDGLPATTDDGCYRAMDRLHQVKDSMEKEIFGQVANLLNLEVDLLFFFTTSTCFELDEEDEPVPRDENDNMTSNEQQMAKSEPVLAASLYDDPAAAA